MQSLIHLKKKKKKKNIKVEDDATTDTARFFFFAFFTYRACFLSVITLMIAMDPVQQTFCLKIYRGKLWMFLCRPQERERLAEKLNGASASVRGGQQQGQAVCCLKGGRRPARR